MASPGLRHERDAARSPVSDLATSWVFVDGGITLAASLVVESASDTWVGAKRTRGPVCPAVAGIVRSGLGAGSLPVVLGTPVNSTVATIDLVAVTIAKFVVRVCTIFCVVWLVGWGLLVLTSVTYTVVSWLVGRGFVASGNVRSSVSRMSTGVVGHGRCSQGGKCKDVCEEHVEGSVSGGKILG